jgi:hypothetical protein
LHGCVVEQLQKVGNALTAAENSVSKRGISFLAWKLLTFVRLREFSRAENRNNFMIDLH